MNPTTNKKLCWNCEGGVECDAGQCPFCGVNLVASDSELEGESLREIPPKVTEYSVASSEVSDSSAAAVPSMEVPPPPYQLNQEVESFKISEEEWNQALNAPESGAGVSSSSEGDAATRPLLFLLPGSVLLLFACILFFFSEDGVLSMRWSARFWPLFFLGSIPLLYFGYKALSEQSENR